MNIIVLNGILWTAENGVITTRRSIRDCMICTFARGLVGCGHNVTLVAAEDFRPAVDEDLGFEIVYLPTRLRSIFKPAYLPWMPSLTSFLKSREDSTDLIISSEAFSLMSWQASRVTPQKLIVWQEMYLHQRKFFTLASRLWHNTVVRYGMTKALFVPRSPRAAAFIKRYARRVSRQWLDHGADERIFYPGDVKSNRFIVVARLVPSKRVDKIIDMFARLTRIPQYSAYCLDVVGDGPEREHLEEQSRLLGLSDNIAFHGHVAHGDMAQMLRRAIALLVYTEKDLNMVSIPEAIVSGTPIVTNSLPANTAYISSEGLGIVDDGWDERSLVDIIRDNDRYRAACRSHRDSLTNTGIARQIVKL